MISPGDSDAIVEEVQASMEDSHKNPQDDEATDDDLATDEPHTPLVEIPDTAVPAERLA